MMMRPQQLFYEGLIHLLITKTSAIMVHLKDFFARKRGIFPTSRLKIQAVFGDLITMYGELRWTSGGPTSHSQTFISNMERQKSCPTFVHENPCFLLFQFQLCLCCSWHVCWHLMSKTFFCVFLVTLISHSAQWLRHSVNPTLTS